MPAYLISICRTVGDRRRVEEYWDNVTPSFAGYGAKPLVAYTPFETLEGHGQAKGIVLYEFPSVEVARRWYTSPVYQEVKQRRLGTAEFELILVDGGWKPASERMLDTKAYSQIGMIRIDRPPEAALTRLHIREGFELPDRIK